MSAVTERTTVEASKTKVETNGQDPAPSIAAVTSTNANATPGKTAGRLLSLDVLRGATVAFMVVVNNPGTWSAIYPPLEHAEWDGWTPTDLVFPFFLFMVGVAISLALSKRIEAGDKGKLILKIIKRSLVIYGCGLFINLFPFIGFPGTLSTVRLTGVLQRIAVCYLCASLIFISTRWRAQAAVTLSILVGYFLVMKLIPTPGYGAGVLTKEGSLASYIDRNALGSHIWKGAKGVYDPEGILSTFPAIATTLTGALAGTWLRRKIDVKDKLIGLFVAGALSVTVGWIWNFWFPINKALWSSSYVFHTTGLALVTLALLYWFIDVKGYKRWTYPFVVFGVNALAVFVLTGLAVRAMTTLYKPLRADGSRGNLQTLIYDHLFAPFFAAPRNASLAYALAFLAFWYLVLWVMYKRNIIIKA